MIRARLRQTITTPTFILTAGWLLFFVYASPGYLSPDSVAQLAEGRAGFLTNWHPPIMAALWGKLDKVVEGPFLMLVLQSGTFLLGLYWVLRSRLSAMRAAITACVILLSPPVLTTMAVIWKDSQMAAYLMAGIACLLSPRRWVRLCGAALLGLATAFRFNAPGATLPLLLALFYWREGLRWWWRGAIAIAAFVVVTGAASCLNKRLTDSEEFTWHCSTAVHDIVGTLSFSPKYPDAELEQMLVGMNLTVHTEIQRVMRRIYDPSTFWGINHGEARVFDRYPQNRDELEAIAVAWKKVVGANPYAYFRHRVRVARFVLGLKYPTWSPVWDGFEDGESSVKYEWVGLEQHHSSWQQWWVDSLKSVSDSLMFRPYLYFVVGLLLLPLCLRDRLPFAILTSGFGYEATLFLGASTPDYRYSHWMITAVIVATVLVFVRRYRKGRADTPVDRSTA